MLTFLRRTVVIPMFTLFREWIIFTREKDYFVLMYGIILGYILERGIKKTVKYDNNGYMIYDQNSYLKVKNLQIISLAIFIVCFVGMVRYVLVFDGGTLANFTSFITEGASIFK